MFVADYTSEGYSDITRPVTIFNLYRNNQYNNPPPGLESMVIIGDNSYHLPRTDSSYLSTYNFTESDKSVLENTLNVYLEQGDWGNLDYRLGEKVFYKTNISKLRYIHSPLKSTYLMFSDCPYLTDVDYLKNVDLSEVYSAGNMFANCPNIKSIPDLNLSECHDHSGMFWNCTELESIGVINMSGYVYEDYLPSGSATGMFKNCVNLKHIGGLQYVEVSINLSDCKQLTRQSILNVFNSASYITNNDEKNVKMYISIETNNLLSDEDRAILINKGWFLNL